MILLQTRGADKKKADFIAINRFGKKLYTKNFIIILKENGRDKTRLGIKVGKKIGSSVKRNRLKRLIREFFRLYKKRIPKGYDIMIIALKESDGLTFFNVQNELGGLLLKNYGIFS